MNEFIFKSYGNSKQTISCCEVDKCSTVIKLSEQFDQLKAKNEELNDLNTRLDNQRETYWKEYQKLKQTLIEVKEIIKQSVKIHDDIIINKQILHKISEVVE